MEDRTTINDRTTITDALIDINCDRNIDERIVMDNISRHIAKNLPFPPNDKQFVGALGLNGEFYRFTKNTR